MTITSEQLIAAKNTTPILDIRPTQEYNEVCIFTCHYLSY